MAEVRPVDLVIGELAARASRVPPTKLSLELWAVSDEQDMSVRVAKSLAYDNGWCDVTLQRQLNGTGNWLPGVEQRRTAKIARIAGETSLLAVSLFYKSGTTGDGEIAAMRQAIDTNAFGEEEYGQTVRIDKHTIGYMNWEGIEIKALHGGRAPDEVSQTGQNLVDSRLKVINGHVEAFHTALQIVATGRRIRPTRPQRGIDPRARLL